MSDEILFQDADGNNFIGTFIKDLWTAVNSVVSMIEVTTMFAP
jgi:hypothetical protein